MFTVNSRGKGLLQKVLQSWEQDLNDVIVTNRCGIKGKWYAKHVATIDLECQPDTSPAGVGTIIGTWSNAPDNHYPLKGRYTQVGTDFYLGFTIAFNNDHLHNLESVSSLTGMYYDPYKSITTFWIMTNKTEPQDNWQNSKIGKAVFQRVGDNN